MIPIENLFQSKDKIIFYCFDFYQTCKDHCSFIFKSERSKTGRSEWKGGESYIRAARLPCRHWCLSFRVGFHSIDLRVEQSTRVSKKLKRYGGTESVT